MNTVVLLIDQEDSQAALDWAVDHSRLTGAKLHVVIADKDASAAPAYVSPSYLADLERQLAGLGVPTTLYDSTNDPARQAIDLVESLPAELAVVGLRKRSVTFKLVLGSHAQHLVLNAPCPVVTVKAAKRSD